MHLHRRVKIQLAVFSMIALIAIGLMAVQFMQLPARLFGAGRYTVVVELPDAAGLYARGNVTYRGVEVGEVESLELTDTGVSARLSLRSGVEIPSNVRAEVHSQSAIGEQYVLLLPQDATSPPLRDGDVIPVHNTSVPADINTVLADAVSGLRAVPKENLRTVIDEAHTAVGGLGPELRRIVTASTDLSIEAAENLDSLIALIEKSKPVLDSQTETADAIQSWAAHVATVTASLRDHDVDLRQLLDTGGGAFTEAQALIDRLEPTVPTVLSNMAGLSEVAHTYHPSVEQLLVLFPQAIAEAQATHVANRGTKQDYRGQYLSFNLNLNLPPPCTTGFLPAQQRRSPVHEDAPEREPGMLYCRTPQDSMWNVRGAKNFPCITRPGKRAPTVQLCESDEQYVPLNDGNNWKGDPNATLSGQDIPQLPPGTVRAHPVARPPQPLVPAELLAGAEEGVQPGGPDTGSGRRSLQSLLVPSEPGQ
ncbi:MAG: MlaD family protein [Mycolicibacterium hassiacum]|nr:MAG: mammalian cell entry protein [Mycolicibacterium hassiacum]